MAVNLFDANLYRSRYPDLAAAGLTTDAQLRQHFENFGINERRQFSRFADLDYYASSYPDLKQGGLSDRPQLFNHMENFGGGEGRRLGVLFNPTYYRAVNPDLVNLTNEQLVQHYQQFGSIEGRTASEFFSPSFYLNTYADLRAAFSNDSINDNLQAAEHFRNNGIAEGRLGSGPVGPAFDPGNTASTAYELGTLVTKPTFNQFVGTSDPEDFYRIILDKPKNLNLNLGGLSANTTLKLFADTNGNQNIDPGEELASASGNNSNPAVINKTVAQGSYYVDVVTGSPSSNTAYSLNFAASAIPSLPTDPGNTPGTALDAGTLIGTRNYQDFVGSTDRDDFYRFALDNFRNFNLSLSGVSDTTVAYLYRDSNNNGVVTDPGEFLASTAATPSAIGTISQTLGAGTYFVDIVPGTPTANTSYNLSLTA